MQHLFVKLAKELSTAYPELIQPTFQAYTILFLSILFLFMYVSSISNLKNLKYSLAMAPYFIKLSMLIAGLSDKIA
jgi:hypothetical protein